MREMKDSGVEWIGEIPKGWEVVRFKRIFAYGKGLPITKENLRKSGIAVISYGQIHSKLNNGLEITEKLIRYVSDDFMLSNPNSLLNIGDIVFADTSEDYLGIGNCIHNDYDDHIFAGYHTIITRPIDDRVYPKYQAFLFNSNAWKDQLRAIANGIKVYSITIKMLNTIFTLLPPLPKQQAIADYLATKCSKIDAIIEGEQAVIEKLKEYKQSLITETVTKGLNPDVEMKDSGVEWIGKMPEHWSASKIKTISYFNPSNPNKFSDNDEIGYVPMECVKNGYMLPRVINYNQISTGLTYFENNDIVLAKVTPCFENGNIAIAKDLKNGVAFGSSELFVLRSKNVVTNFLFYALQNIIFKSLCVSTMTGTGGLKRVSLEFIKNFKFHLPPLPEQQAIADYLDQKCTKIDSAISRKQALIDKLGEYKKSLIYEVVTGKMEVVQ